MSPPLPPPCGASVAGPAPGWMPRPSGTERWLPEDDCTASSTTSAPLACSSTQRRRRQRVSAAQRAALLIRGPAVSASAQVPPSPPLSSSSSSTSRNRKAKATLATSALLFAGRVAELTAQLEAGSDAQSAALASLTGSIRCLSFDGSGCRLVQLALRVASRQQAAAFLSELHGHVRAGCNSPHANWVFQTAVDLLPTPLTLFVAEELRGSGAEVARSKFGCRILCRLLEHHPGSLEGDDPTARLVDEVLEVASELCRHCYGHHVIQCVLEHGGSEHRRSVARAVSSDALCNARNQHASFVCEKILTCCAAEERRSLADKLLDGRNELAAVAESQFGCYVVRALLRLPPEQAQVVLEELRPAAAQLRASKYGLLALGEQEV
eukprot:gnl/TRDRNA2_/TRDRNA2_87910_c0_seq1.p1 gnl/TRDRNA2_/TRDRNA2_87910_c0~~gnl/TRDRNA2_/TRDRNA2_87910_c0_seq1.p1  ORF type:complete len:442 (-),score=62.07 gnl/TRDRNA2_/TRDRNA2_87910_c0_seq1:194-1336(-)